MGVTSWLFLLITLIWNPEALRLQKLSVFSENCCKGKGELYDGSVRNLEKVSMVVNRGQMKSFSIHHGLWALSLGANYTKGGIYYEGNNDDIHGTCGTSEVPGGGNYIQYKSIRTVGNARVNLPGLSFFTAEGFQGEELYFDGLNLRLPTPSMFTSYGFTAKDNWTMFPFTDFSGDPVCLVAQKKTVSFSSNVTITVGSVQRGCVPGRKDGKKPTLARSKIGDPQALILFRNTNPNSDRLYTDGLELRLPTAFQFQVYSFFGSKNWTVFSELDLTGPSVCLYNPKSSIVDRSKGVAALRAMTVGSVRRGCESDLVKESATPLPEISDQRIHLTGTAMYLKSRWSLFSCIIAISTLLRG